MTDAEAVDVDPKAGERFDLGQPVALYPLVYLEDGDDVTVGCRDIDSYAVLDPDGAALVRKLAEGLAPRDVVLWYEQRYGATVDIDEVLEGLDEMGFIRPPGESAPVGRRVRWQRLGRIVFSWPALLAYGLLIVWALVEMAYVPAIRPSYHDIFFTSYYSLIEIGLFIVAIPLLLLHECFHALAGRRLGLPSKLSIGRRFYFLVLETEMDSLVTVPRRQRYLPILAGILCDLVMAAAFTLVAAYARNGDGTLTIGARFCLAVSFSILLRILWQFSLYLRTDLYALVSTLFGCLDLHTTAKQMVANRINRFLRRDGKLHDESVWHPVDRKIARWYSWLVFVGYTASLATFVIALAPIAIGMFIGALSRFFGSQTHTSLQVVDSAVFLLLSLLPTATVVVIAARDRWHRRHPSTQRHVID